MIEEFTPLFRAQRARLADAKAAEPEGSHPHTHQTPDRKTQHQETAADLSFAALEQGQAKARSARIGVSTHLFDAAR